MTSDELFIEAINDISINTVESKVLTNKLIKKFGIIDKLDSGLTTVVYNTISHDTVVGVTTEIEKVNYLSAISDTCDLGFRLLHTKTIDDDEPKTYYVYQMKKLTPISYEMYDTDKQFKEAKLIIDLSDRLDNKEPHGNEVTIKALELIIPFIANKSLLKQCEEAVKAYDNGMKAIENIHENGIDTKYSILDIHKSNIMYNNTTKQVVLLDPAFQGKPSDI